MEGGGRTQVKEGPPEVAEKKKVPVEGSDVTPGSDIARSIDKMEKDMEVLDKELSKVRERLAAARSVADEKEDLTRKMEELIKEKKRIRGLIQYQQASIKNHRWENAKTGILSLLFFLVLHFVLYQFGLV